MELSKRDTAEPTNPVSLDSLPPEIWNKILSYLRAHWRHLCLKRVCKLFNEYIFVNEIDVSMLYRLRKILEQEESTHKSVRILHAHKPATGIEWRRAETNPTVLPDKILRIAIVGTNFSGRKSLMHALCGQEKPIDPKDFQNECSTFVYCNNQLLELKFFVRNNEGNKAFPETVFNPAEHFDLKILVFDISFRASFLAIEDTYIRLPHLGTLFTVVGTKSDLEELRAIDVLPCKAVPRYIEVSAKTGANIDKLMSKILYNLEHRFTDEMHDEELRKKLLVEYRSNQGRLKKTENQTFDKQLESYIQEDVNWRFVNKNELKNLSRDYSFTIDFYGPLQEINALIRSIQIHGPCASSEAEKTQTYVLYENKSIIHLILNAVPFGPDYSSLRLADDLEVHAFSVDNYESFSSIFNDPSYSPLLLVGIIPEHEHTRQVFYDTSGYFFDVCPSTYMNVERLVGKILKRLQYLILSGPTFVHEETWIDYAEALALDDNEPTIVQYKQVLEKTKSRTDCLRTNGTWRWHTVGNRLFTNQRVEIFFAGAKNVGKTMLINGIVNEFEKVTKFRRYDNEVLVLHEDKTLISLALKDNDFPLNPTRSLTIFCFNIDDIESFNYLSSDDPFLVLSLECPLLFVGTRLSTSPESNRQVFLQHLNNTTERYIEVCIDKQESVQELMTKIVYCSTQWIDFHREITQKELDQAFEGVIDPDDLNEFDQAFKGVIESRDDEQYYYYFVPEEDLTE